MAETMLKVTEFIYGLAVLLVVLGGIIVLLLIRISDIRITKKFYKATIRTLENEEYNTIKDYSDSIKNNYSVFRKYRETSLIKLCQELLFELKNDDSNRYCLGNKNKIIKKLERVIILYEDEQSFEDDKIDRIIKLVKEKGDEESARELKEFLIRLKAYYKGILFEKDRNLSDIQNKLKRKRWTGIVSGVVGIIGVTSGIITIFDKLL